MTRLSTAAPTATVFAGDAALQIGPNRVTILRDSWCAGGALRDFENNGIGIVAYEAAPRYIAPQFLRWHTREGWSGTVLDGRLEVRFADRRETVSRGGTLLVPARCPFSWRNPDDAPACILFTYTPGGFENYFRDAAALYAADAGRSDIAAELEALWPKYGLESEI